MSCPVLSSFLGHHILYRNIKPIRIELDIEINFLRTYFCTSIYDCSRPQKCSFSFSKITYYMYMRSYKTCFVTYVCRLYLSFGPVDNCCEFLIRLDIWIENSCAVQRFSLATMEHLKGLGTLFYVIDPYSTMYEKISDLPHPDFMSKVLVQILQWYEITKKIREGDLKLFNKNGQYFFTKYLTRVPSKMFRRQFFFL